MAGADAKTSGAASSDADSGENEVKIVINKDQGKLIKVTNTSKGNVCTSQGVIGPGETGKATVAEARQYHKKLSPA
jgi:hypothetical protein